MSDLEEILKNNKNPFKLKSKLNDNQKKLFDDSNSYLWNNLINYFFFSLIDFKNSDVSLKGYYILLYLVEKMGINDVRIIIRSQSLISILPKIYAGDMVCIINACCNTAILSGKYKVNLFRKNIDTEMRVYGKGMLKYQYIKSDKDIYSDNMIAKTSDKDIDSFNGCFNPLIC